MREEDKELLLRDLCARIPYGVKVYNEPYTFDLDNFEFSSTISETILEIIKEGWKPYLRSMSSMTEEEYKEYASYYDMDLRNYHKLAKPQDAKIIPMYNYIDWLNAHHFDYRGLIEKGLALEVPKNMYKFD